MSDLFDAGAVSDLEDPSTRGFELPNVESAGAAFFVVKKNAQVYAYRNKCPHTGAPLEWVPDQFFDLDNSFIQCSIHGALFRVKGGVCLRGPCAGQALTELPVEIKAGKIFVDVSVIYSEQVINEE